MIDTIILAAKYNNDVNVYDPLMVPLHGKPVIDYVIDNLQDLRSAVVVINKNNTNIQQYLQLTYPNLKLSLIDASYEENKYGINTILNSLNNGLEHINEKVNLVKVILGDTVCKITGLPNSDVIITSTDFDDSARWCLVDVDKDNNVINFYDKKKIIDISGKHTIIGYYQFTDVKRLKRIVLNKLDNKCPNISDVLKEYNSFIPLKAIEAEQWYDLGHKSGVVKAQNSFFNSREFNSLYVDAIRGTITKMSSKQQKLEDEKFWYTHLPKEIQSLVPRVFSFEKNINNAILTMELYGYQALSELFILGNLSFEEWKLILNRLFKTYNLLMEHTGNVSTVEFSELYYEKTIKRIEELNSQNFFWENLYDYQCIVINGVSYKNIKCFEKRILDKVLTLVETPVICIMHGDFCFSNILFDTNNFVCKLIDPRGRLKEQTIFGDARYDIAKLRHSVVGKYDYIVHGLYKLYDKDNDFIYSEVSCEYQDKLAIYFDDLVVENGFELKEIKFIEALLFLTMIPLHKDSMNRQKAFYLKAVMKFNEIFKEEEHE